MDQLNRLMQYTIFHIGAYLTLGALMVALLGLETFRPHANAMRVFLVIALLCFLLAGIFGGLVAANLPYADNFTNFTTTAWVGTWVVPRLLPAWLCMNLEHAAFWVGLIVFLFGFGVTGAWKAA